MAAATSSAQLARLLGTQRTTPPTKNKNKRCPRPNSVKMKIYYPDASQLPSRFLATTALLNRHMQQGYGKKCSIYVVFFSMYCHLQEVAVFMSAGPAANAKNHLRVKVKEFGLLFYMLFSQVRNILERRNQISTILLG